MTPAGFGARGEGYVALQLLFLAIVAVGPREPGLGAAGTGPAAGAAAVLFLVLGAVLSVSGLLRLGRNLTPLPRPKESGALVDRGIYALVRHPIYGGLILLAFGGALRRNSLTALVAAVLLTLVLVAKSGREESWLMAKYSGYAAYRSRTRRFLPFLW